MAKAVIWSKEFCSHCDAAKALLNQKGILYEERRIGSEWTKEQLLTEVPNAKSVPQIFLDNYYVGGFEELKRFLK